MATNRIDSYFEPAVESILAQTFTDFELLILIDTGCGGVHAEIPAVFRQDPRIRIVEAPPLGGLAYALNMGIAAARGEFIARMDADDISKPDRLMEQVAYLDEHKDVDVLGCRIQLIDSNSRKLERKSHYFQTNEEIRNVLPYRNPLFHPALIFRKKALLSVGGYKYGHYSEDHEMFIRMARDPDVVFHNLDKFLYEHRRHEGQGTNARNLKKAYSEVSGFLFTEFIRTYSPKYLFGMVIVNPSIRKIRMALRKFRYGTAD
jgi:glycosyltransferase involved in cell wall biosynthesis